MTKTTKFSGIQAYQGDICIMKLPENFVPSTDNPVKLINGRCILAEGEVTGHFHAFADVMQPEAVVTPVISDFKAENLFEKASGGAADVLRKALAPTVSLFKDAALMRSLVEEGVFTNDAIGLCQGFLVVNKDGVELTHNEHDTISFDRGVYYVGRQQEMDAGKMRIVAD